MYNKAISFLGEQTQPPKEDTDKVTMKPDLQSDTFVKSLDKPEYDPIKVREEELKKNQEEFNKLIEKPQKFQVK